MVALACVAHMPSIVAGLTKNPFVVQFTAISFINMVLIQVKILGCSLGMVFNLVLNAVAFWKFSLQVLGPRTSVLEVLIRQRGRMGAQDPESDLQPTRIATRDTSREEEEGRPLIRQR